MAANIFKPSDYAVIKKRINLLSENSHRKWGKMNLPQALEHCSIQLKKALGIIPESSLEGPVFFRNAIGRWLVLYGLPWPKGSATPSEMNMSKNTVKLMPITDAKINLLNLLEAVQERDNFNPHPFMGKMNKKDWGRMIWKHLDHHLRQFGC